MGHVKELKAIEQASQRTAKAALRYQNRTEHVNRKIGAVGVITKSVNDQLTTIANIDEREFETLSAVIDGQVELSQQATTLDTQWHEMMELQRNELEQLQRINASLKTAHQNKVGAIEALNESAEENHLSYMNTLASAEEKLASIGVQIGTLDTRELISQIDENVESLHVHLEDERKEQEEFEAQLNTRMNELRNVSKMLLASVGHYTNVIQTVEAKVNYLENIVDVLDEKVSRLTPLSDGMSESDIIEMFSALSQPIEETAEEPIEEPIEEDVVEDEITDTDDTTKDVAETENKASEDVAETEDKATEDKASDDKASDDKEIVSEVPPRSSRHTSRSEKTPKWKFWAK